LPDLFFGKSSIFYGSDLRISTVFNSYFYFLGNAIEPSFLNLPLTPHEIRNQGVFAKVKKGAKIATILPWFMKNKPDARMHLAIEFVELLRSSEFGYTKLAAVG
jgi:hypothetical protein